MLRNCNKSNRSVSILVVLSLVGLLACGTLWAQTDRGPVGRGGPTWETSTTEATEPPPPEPEDPDEDIDEIPSEIVSGLRIVEGFFASLGGPMSIAFSILRMMLASS